MNHFLAGFAGELVKLGEEKPYFTLGKGKVTKLPKKKEPYFSVGKATMLPKKKEPYFSVGKATITQRGGEKVQGPTPGAPTAAEWSQKIDEQKRLKALAAKSGGKVQGPTPGAPTAAEWSKAQAQPVSVAKR